MPGRVPPFVQVFQEEAKTLLTPRHLTAQQWVVFWCCVCHCDYQGEVPLTPQQIAAVTGLRAPKVWEALRRLVVLGHLLRTPHPRGSRSRYFLPSTLIHKGPLEHVAWKQDYDRLRVREQLLTATIEASALSTLLLPSTPSAVGT